MCAWWVKQHAGGERSVECVSKCGEVMMGLSAEPLSGQLRERGWTWRELALGWACPKCARGEGCSTTITEGVA